MIKQNTYRFFLLCIAIILNCNLSFAKNDGPGCRWTVKIGHKSINCYEQDRIDQLTRPPIVISECTPVSVVHQKDVYHDLGCTQQGFNGYFAIPKWDFLQLDLNEKTKDGDVDNVTYTESELLLSAPAKTRQQLKIVAPAEGYLSFTQSTFGSKFLKNKVFVNGKLLKNVFRKSGDDLFFSLLLKSGDELTLQFDNADSITSTFVLSELRFLSNALGVVERQWLAVGENATIKKIKQFITIDKANIADVLIPEDLSQVKETTPNKTGYPLMDEDGVSYTTDDQIELSTDIICQLAFEYEDEEREEVPESVVIYRLWSITDKCSGNRLREIQKLYKFKDSDFDLETKTYGGK